MENLKSKILDETNRTIRIGTPIVAAQLIQMSMGFTDTIMAGNLSARDLAAVAVGGSLFTPLFVFCMGALMGVNPVVAHLTGAGRTTEIGRNLWSAVWLSQFLAIPSMLILFNMEFVMNLFKIKAELIPLAQGYVSAVAIGFPAAFAYMALRFFHEGLTVTKPAMFFAVVGLAVNILGNYIFMYGKLGFPALGAVGTGWATALVHWVMLLCMVAFTFRKRIESSAKRSSSMTRSW